MDKERAIEFAGDWIDAWNSHDLERIIDHYSDDFEMSSPVIVKRMGVSGGTLVGKKAVREYWSGALSSFPDLRFELRDVLCGVGYMTIVYVGATGGLAAETFWFNSEGLVYKACATYK